MISLMETHIWIQDFLWYYFTLLLPLGHGDQRDLSFKASRVILNKRQQEG